MSLVKEHYTVIEIDAPIVNAGFGTPTSAGDIPSTGTKTYKFTDCDGIIAESGVWKCVNKVSETPTKLTPDKGLAIRATASIQMTDFQGDPNPEAPNVTPEVLSRGGYLAKFDIRNILTNKPCRVKDYIVGEGLQRTKHYLIDSFSGNGNGKWTLKLKDELSRVNLDESVWPLEQSGFLRQAIDSTATTLKVDGNLSYSAGQTIRIGDELMRINSVSGIGGSSAEITVQNRGSDIVYTNRLSKTDVDDHDAGDEIFICHVSNNEHIADFLERVLLDIGIDPSHITKANWIAELDEWLPTERLNTIWAESKGANEQLISVLRYFMIDMWMDSITRQIKISTTNVWKESTKTLIEGSQIDYKSIKRKAREDLRATRALVVHDKRYIARTDSIENYKKSNLFIRPELESDDNYGESKVKHFEFSSVIGSTSAALLVNRYVNRYIRPFEYTWTTQESKLDFEVGEVVNIVSSIDVGFDGLPNTSARGQVLSIQPKYGIGREYAVTALTYEPQFTDNTEIVITGSVVNINLYTQYAGAPGIPVNITFVLDNVTASSTSKNIPSIVAGNFPAGSKITIIMTNSSFLCSKGGDGGSGSRIIFDDETLKWRQIRPVSAGRDGGVVYDAQGVDTDIYFSGSTPSSAYPIANGYLFAPSGGDGGFNSIPSSNPDDATPGNGGDGGDGSSPGNGGAYGSANDNDGSVGADGTNNRLTGSFGQDGVANDGGGGLAGSGVIDNGATVNFFGSNAARYINGNGDH